MLSVIKDIYPTLLECSRYLFALLGVLIALSAFAWLVAENRSRRERLRSLPAAGTVGELVVLSGGPELSPQTWFPVPREGVLGSFRSCDLVVPCAGVRSRHLDFAWRDGAGLLIRPRSGCEALVNGVLLDCRSDSSACPLTHGALLQIGDAVLRLQVFKAMDHTTVRPVRQETAPPVPDDTGVPPVVQAGMFVPPMISDGMPVTPPCPAHSPVGPAFAPAVPQSADPAEPVPVPVPPVSSPRRADRWKEDWGE